MRWQSAKQGLCVCAATSGPFLNPYPQRFCTNASINPVNVCHIFLFRNLEFLKKETIEAKGLRQGLNPAAMFGHGTVAQVRWCQTVTPQLVRCDVFPPPPAADHNCHEQSKWYLVLFSPDSSPALHRVQPITVLGKHSTGSTGYQSHCFFSFNTT